MSSPANQSSDYWALRHQVYGEIFGPASDALLEFYREHYEASADKIAQYEVSENRWNRLNELQLDRIDELENLVRRRENTIADLLEVDQEAELHHQALWNVASRMLRNQRQELSRQYNLEVAEMQRAQENRVARRLSFGDEEDVFMEARRNDIEAEQDIEEMLWG